MEINAKRSRRPAQDKVLPSYTRGEERFNMITHIVGGGLGVLALLACVLVAALRGTTWGVVSGAVYGATMILLFTVSSVYHGLRKEGAKRVFRIIDHCTIFLLIAGTYTPMLLNQFRVAYPVDAWLTFSAIWALAVLGIVLNAISLHRFRVFSIICYLGMGWAALFRLQRLVEVLGAPFFTLILLGGVLYTVGVVFYGLGRKKKYMHSIFHLFVNAAAILHAVAIAVYIMPH